jgi:hypothetical protein
MQTNLYAYTEPTPTDGYPGYLSLNKQADESITLTVRSPGHGGNQVGTITVPPAVLRWLASAIKYEALGEAGAGG